MAETTTWAIKDWDTAFECAASRKLAKVTYLQLRCKVDGLAYRRLMRRTGGLEAYGVFMALVQVAAKCDVRGVLARDGKPLSMIDLEDLTSIPKDAIEKAIEILTLADIGWLVAYFPASVADSVLSVADSGENRSTTKPNQKNRTNQPTNQPAQPEPEEPAGGRRELSPDRGKIADVLTKPPWVLAQTKAREIAHDYEPAAVRWTIEDIGRDKNARRPGRILLARIESGALRELSNTHEKSAKQLALASRDADRRRLDLQREKSEAAEEYKRRQSEYHAETGKDPTGKEFVAWRRAKVLSNSPQNES